MTEERPRTGPGLPSRYAKNAIRRELRRGVREAGGRAGGYPPAFEAGAAVSLGCLVALAALLPYDCPQR